MKAIVVGSTNTDLIIHVDTLPSAGNTEVGHGFRSAPGGKGANQAVCLARLGAGTSLIARFGKDEFSRGTLENIERKGIDLSRCVIDEKHRGGIVFIIVDRNGDNTMFADLGSNLFLNGSDIENAEALFTGADLLLLQFEVSDGANKKACELAEINNVKIVLNPAPVRKFDKDIFDHVDLLTPNMHELSWILEYTEGRSIISPDEKDTGKIGKAAGRLTAYGIGHVLVTAGKRGCIYVTPADVRTFGTYRVKQVDSTAAGDAFTAALALKFAEGMEITDAVRYASACAAITVSREGAIPSLPDSDEVEGFIMKNRIMEFE